MGLVALTGASLELRVSFQHVSTRQDPGFRRFRIRAPARLLLWEPKEHPKQVLGLPEETRRSAGALNADSVETTPSAPERPGERNETQSLNS